MQTVWEESVESVWREDLWFKAVKSGTEADLENMEKQKKGKEWWGD